MARWPTSSCRTSRNRLRTGIPRPFEPNYTVRTQGRERPVSGATRVIEVRRLGLMRYPEAVALQRSLVEDRRGERGADQLLFVEHPHVLTLGVRGDGGRG